VRRRLLDRLVSHGAALAVLGSLMPLAARHGWAFDLATHFRAQYVVVDALLVFACFLQRKPIWSLVLAAGAAFSAQPLLPYVAVVPAAVADAPVSGPPIELLSANVLFENHSATRLLEIIHDAAPDVVLLVEYTPEWAQMIGELRAAYPHHIERPRDDPYGIALFSRYELDGVEPFALGDTTAIEASVRTPSGPLAIIGVHLRAPTSPSRAEMRNRQLDELATRVAQLTGPLAVMGDFNITPYSPYFQDWLARTALTDTRRGRTPSPSWPTTLPILAIPIDHCVVSHDVEIIGHRRLPAFGSDHYPILAELALAPPVVPVSATTSTKENSGAVRE
jgi:endonuclease/exonuclease/phosphatase (EEP) superfamily protein YafD